IDVELCTRLRRFLSWIDAALSRLAGLRHLSCGPAWLLALVTRHIRPNRRLAQLLHESGTTFRLKSSRYRGFGSPYGEAIYVCREGSRCPQIGAPPPEAARRPRGRKAQLSKKRILRHWRRSGADHRRRFARLAGRGPDDGRAAGQTDPSLSAGNRRNRPLGL